MANIRFLKARDRWEVRKRYKNRETGVVVNLHKMTFTKKDAYLAAVDFDERVRLAKMGQIKTLDLITVSVEKWLKKINCCTPRTYKHYDAEIKQFMKFLPAGIQRIDQIDPPHISDYIDGILSTKTARTANSKLTVLKSFCRWFSRLYDIHNPAEKIDFLREEPPDRRFLTPEEYEKTLAVVDESTADKFKFLANTGLRVSEFCELRWIDIAEDMDSLSIIGKGRKRRTIPLNRTCRDILDKLRTDNREHVFVSGNFNAGPRLNRHTVYDYCFKAAAKAKISSFGPHAFRHFFATELLKKDVPLFKVSQLMGHSSTKMTQSVYAHILPGDLRGATDVLEKIKPAVTKPQADIDVMYVEVKYLKAIAVSHHFATRLFTSGIPAAIVSSILGQVSTETTGRVYNPIPARLADAAGLNGVKLFNAGPESPGT